MRVTLFVFLLAADCRAFLWSQPQRKTRHAIYELVPADASQKGNAYLSQLQEASSAETFLDKLFGTDCYSAALGDMGAECSRLGQAEKPRLAFALSNCHLRQLGQAARPCTQAMSLKQCADSQDARGYSTYLKFLAEIDSMCLFIQSQDFQKHAEHMLNVLYGGSRYATEALANATMQLDSQAIERSAEDLQNKQLKLVRGDLSGIQAGQEAVAEKVQESLTAVHSIFQQAVGLQAQMQTSINLEASILAKQALAHAAFEQHEDAEKQRADASLVRWQAAEAHAKALMQQQSAYQQTQQQLLSDMREMSASSTQLRESVAAVLSYARRSDTVLSLLLGQSYSFNDLLFYGGCLIGIWALGAVPNAASSRLPLAGLLGVTLAIERASCSATVPGEHDLSSGILQWHAFGGNWVETAALNYFQLYGKSMLRRAFLATAAVIVTWCCRSANTYDTQIARELRRLQDRLIQTEARHFQALQDVKLRILEELDAAQRLRNQLSSALVPYRSQIWKPIGTSQN